MLGLHQEVAAIKRRNGGILMSPEQEQTPKEQE